VGPLYHCLLRDHIPREQDSPDRLHDACYTYATWLLQSGVSLQVVSDQLGHAGIAITADVYSHVTTTVARQAADTLSTAFTTGL
jgi:site-specific recombinase XerD